MKTYMISDAFYEEIRVKTCNIDSFQFRLFLHIIRAQYKAIAE